MIDYYEPTDLRAERTPHHMLTHGQWCKGFGWVTNKTDAAAHGCTCGAVQREADRFEMARDAQLWRIGVEQKLIAEDAQQKIGFVWGNRPR